MPLPKKRRNRVRKPAWSFGGMTAAEWRATSSLVEWSQTAPEWRALLTLIVNDRDIVLSTLPPATENCLLGRHQAYDALRSHLLRLAEGVTLPPQVEEMDYSPDSSLPSEEDLD